MTMSKLETDINIYLATEDAGVITDCVNQIKCGQLKLVDFVAGLGTPLTSKETQPRRRGMQLLADVVRSLPAELFSDAEVALLVEFFCARLGDHHSITPIALAGIAALIGHKSLKGTELVKILRCIFSEVTVQTLVHSDRMMVYRLFEQVLSDRIPDLQAFGTEFINGVTQAVDSEKDPRNLLVCFGLVRAIAQNFSLDGVAETLFEVIACYFPIDFSPPSSSQITVTKDQLVRGLLDAMTATQEFAPFCLPLLQEKLASSLTDAKLISLETLIKCCDVYRQKNLAEHAAEFWNLIRSDVFAQRDKVEGTALLALTNIARHLSHEDAQGHDTHLDSFIAAIFEECGKYLYEPEQIACKQSGKLLSSVCRASLPACIRLVRLVVPVLVSEFHLRTSSTKRKGMLEVLVMLLRAAGDVALPSEHTSPLLEYKEALTVIFVSLLSNADSTLRSAAVEGLACLLELQPFLADDERESFMQHLFQMLLNDGDDAVRQECAAVIVNVSAKQPTIVCKSVLPPLAVLLRDEKHPEGVAFGKHVDEAFLLETIASISVHPSVVIEAVPVLFEHVCFLVNSTAGSSSRVSLSCSCLTTVVTMMSCECSVYFLTWLAPRCVAMVLSTCVPKKHVSENQNSAVAGLTRTVQQIVQRAKDADEIHKFVSSSLSLFLHGDLTCFQSEEAGNNIQTHFRPLEENAPKEHTSLLQLLTAIVCSSPYDVIAPSSDELMLRLFDVVFHSCPDDASFSACKCLAGLINRRPSDAFLDDVLEKLRSKIAAFVCVAGDLPSQRNALNASIWITKALVLRNHPQQSTFLQFLIDSLANVELASAAADGFKLVLSDNAALTDGIFSEASRANITLMYRQRFFMLSLAPLLKKYSTAVNKAKSFYVIALTHLMQFVPKQVLAPEIPQLLPVLMQSLMAEESSLWPTAIKTITELAVENPETLHSYIDDLLPRLMTLCAYSADMKVRIAALCCVGELASMPVHLIVPQLKNVLQCLGTCLDDHKRHVRQEAVAARTKWFLIESADS